MNKQEIERFKEAIKKLKKAADNVLVHVLSDDYIPNLGDVDCVEEIQEALEDNFYY